MDRLAASNRCARARGFTLVELMIAVAIVALLSALAVYGVRKYIMHSKTVEAVEMLGAIRAAQEAYKADTFAYKDVSGNNSVSGSGDSYPNFYPQPAPLRREKASWGGGDATVAAAWAELGVSATSPVLYIYGCAAGPGSMAPAATGALTIGNYPSAAPGAPWYLCKAVGDLDGDGANEEFGASSLADGVATAGGF